MPDLVAEVAEQRTVGLAHREPTLLALGVVRLDKRDNDPAFVVAGEDPRPRLRRVGKELERQAARRIVDHGPKRQLPLQQRIEQPVLGHFHQLPRTMLRRIAEIRDDAIVPAGEAEGVAGAGRHQPVADVVLGVLAEKARLIDIGERDPAYVVGHRLDRRHGVALGHIGHPVPAFIARGIFEIENVAARLAFKQFHGCPENDDAA